MAVGTIFTEIDLDLTKFVAKQKSLLKQIEQVGVAAEKGLQQSFTNLGVTTDAVYQLMANKAIASYARITASGQASAAEQVRAQASMVAKINSLNQQMAANPLYETLGIKSQAAYKAQEAAIMASYNTIKNSGTATSQDLINIERAKNTKLKELNKEMVGNHEMSMASMTRAVLRFYAAYYVISTVVGVVGRAFMDGVATIDKMQLSAVTVAATITNLQGTSGNVAENYKKNLEYAKGLVPVLMQIDAASLANLEQVQLINNAMALHGVILDGSNKKQVESATALTNTIAIMTVGQNKEQQATQETNALLNGEVGTRGRVALMLDQMIKRQGDYKDGIKGLNAEAAKHNDWLERIAPYLVGIRAAVGDISNTWEAVSSSLKTTWMILQTEIFADFYKGLVTGGQEAIGWARKNASEIGQSFRIAMNMVGDAIGAVWGVLKGFGPLLIDLGILIAPIAYGFGAVLAALKPIGEVIGNAIAQTYLLGKAIVSTALAASSLAHLDFEGAKLYWKEAKKGYSEVHDLQKKNFNLIKSGVADSLVAYDKQYNAARKAAGAGYVPTVIPGKDKEKEAEKESTILRNKLAEATALNKEYYDDAIAKSDHWLKMQKISGQGDLEATKEVIDQKKVALTTWYNAQAASINKYVDSESKRAAELEKLWREYSKSWTKLQYDNAEIAAQITKKETDDAITAMEKDIALGVKETEEHLKGAAEYQKIMADEYAFSTNAHEQSTLRIIEREKEKYAAIQLLQDKGLISFKEAEDAKKKISENRAKEETILAAQTLATDVQNLATGLGSMASAFETMSQMYAEDSSERKTYHDISMGLMILEKAAMVAQAYVTGTLAVLQAGTSGPYVQFAMMAAMAAAVAVLLAQIGVAFSGGGGGGASAPKTASTVLGAADGTASESIANSMKLMEDTYTMEDTKLTAIYNALKELSSSIIGLVTSIFRMGGISTTGYESSWMPGSEVIQSAAKNTLTTAFNAIFISMGDWISLIFGSNRLVENFMNVIFGSVDTEFQSGGIQIGATIVKSIMDGASISAQWYAKTKTTTTGSLWGLFGGNSESTGIKYSPLEQEVSHMLTLVFSNLGTTLVELAKGLGTDVQKVYDYVFKTTQIDLNGMDAEKMSKALSDYFSSIADKAAEDLFGTIILQYQKLNEALLETAVRLVNDKAIVEGVLKMTGQAVTFASDAFKNGFGTLWTYPEGVRGLERTATEKMIAFSEALIEMAGGLDKLTEAASTFFDKFYSDVEKQAILQSNLTSVLALQNETLPVARDGYRALVEGLDLTTKSGQEAYVTLLKLSETADAYYAYLEEVASKRQDLEIQIMELTGDAAGALAAQRDIELAAMDESLRPLQERIWGLQDEATATEAAEAAAKEAADAQNAIASKRRDLEIQIMTLTGDAAGALAAQRADELAAMDSSLWPLQQRIYALQDEAQAITDLTTAVDTLKTRAQTIAQFITDMGMSAQAPVQSAAVWDTEYTRQRTLAMASGATDQQISDYLAFAKQYLSFEQSYGTAGSYQEIYDAIMKDVTGLGTATNTALSIAQKQLDVLIQIRDGGALATQKIADDAVGWLKTYVDTAKALAAQTSLEVTNGNGTGIFNPIINTWPTTDKTYAKSDQQSLGKIIAAAIMDSNGGTTSGDIHVSVTIDGREIGNVVAKQTKTNSDLQQSIRSLN